MIGTGNFVPQLARDQRKSSHKSSTNTHYMYMHAVTRDDFIAAFQLISSGKYADRGPVLIQHKADRILRISVLRGLIVHLYLGDASKL